MPEVLDLPPASATVQRGRKRPQRSSGGTFEGGTWLFCDTDSIAVVASPKGGTVHPKRPEEENEMDQREIAPIPVLSHAKVLKIASAFPLTESLRIWR
jgi:hypothetical protein